MKIKGRKLRKLIGHREISKRVKELAKEIERDMGQDFVVIGLLKGSFIFLADLVRNFKKPVVLDFMWVSSYGSSMSSSGHVEVIKDVGMDIEGKKVLLVDDILDTGYTIKEVREILKVKGAKEVRVCTLLDKRGRRKVDVHADYVGFVVEDVFLVGYGLDWAEEGRNLKDVYAVE